MRPYDTHQWQQTRKRILRHNPLCVRCQAVGVVRLATIVDHCVPAKDYDDFFDTENLYPVCMQCHSDITKHYDNRNAHHYITGNYSSIKYSGREFTRDHSGFPKDEALDQLLLSLEVVGNKDTRPYFESCEE